LSTGFGYHAVDSLLSKRTRLHSAAVVSIASPRSESLATQELSAYHGNPSYARSATDTERHTDSL